MTSHGDLVHRETFWLADQDDVRHLLSDLRVFGYAERLKNLGAEMLQSRRAPLNQHDRISSMKHSRPGWFF